MRKYGIIRREASKQASKQASERAVRFNTVLFSCAVLHIIIKATTPH
ncbi:MAG: hypothetical protein FWH05_00545 [Oscillospiraceae bacterium]|nr:hypothetical protein [Oscillospiraceae bacterium]